MDGYRGAGLALQELGAGYNGWSLNESKLSAAIEATGSAIDTCTSATNTLETNLQEFDLFVWAYIQFSRVIEKLLVKRHGKHCEFEVTSETLITKQQLVTKLEASEYESQRLAAVIREEIGTVPQPQQLNTAGGIIGKISKLIDTDPEMKRRNTLSKTKDHIIQLENLRESSRVGLLKMNEEIQVDLDRFQRQKIRDFRDAFLGYALAHNNYHAKCLEAWKRAAEVVDLIEDSI